MKISVLISIFLLGTLTSCYKNKHKHSHKRYTQLRMRKDGDKTDGGKDGDKTDDSTKAPEIKVGPDADLSGRRTVNITLSPIDLDGWLRIGSDSFEDKARFPNIPMMDNGQMGKFDPLLLAMEQGGQKFKNSIGNMNFGKDKSVNFIDKFYVRL